jgi:hypothetical protein
MALLALLHFPGNGGVNASAISPKRSAVCQGTFSWLTKSHKIIPGMFGLFPAAALVNSAPDEAKQFIETGIAS